MLRRDYIMKMLQDLFAAVSRLLSEGNASLSERQKDLLALYTMLGNNADFFRQSHVDDIMLSLTEFEDDYIERVEMLAEIMYADALIGGNSDGQIEDLRRKSLHLYSYVEKHSDAFNMVRQQRIAELQGLLRK